MEKAYDISELGKIVKEEAAKAGLPLAEEAVEALGKAVYGGFKRWVKESATVSENKLDDVFAPFIDQLDPMVLPQIEKVDLDGDGK